MLQVTIKDIKTNEVIYDEQVCMIIMQAIEEEGVRSLRQTSEEADLSDVVACFEAVRQASVDANNVLLKSLNYAMKRACPEEGVPTENNIAETTSGVYGYCPSRTDEGRARP